MYNNEQFEKNVIATITVARAGAINPSSEIEDLQYKERCLERVYWKLCKDIIPYLINNRIISKNSTINYLTDLSSLEYKEIFNEVNY